MKHSSTIVLLIAHISQVFSQEPLSDYYGAEMDRLGLLKNTANIKPYRGRGFRKEFLISLILSCIFVTFYLSPNFFNRGLYYGLILSFLSVFMGTAVFCCLFLWSEEIYFRFIKYFKHSFKKKKRNKNSR